MPVSRRRIPKERPPQRITRRRRVMRVAMATRMEAERQAIDAVSHLYSKARLEEKSALRILKNMPSIFFFAEMAARKLDVKYERPIWASQRYGAQ